MTRALRVPVAGGVRGLWAHWGVPVLNGKAVPQEILDVATREFGVTMHEDHFFKGWFGNVYPTNSKTLVVKFSVDWLEAGTSKWIMAKQGKRQAATSACRTAFPKVLDVIALQGPLVDDFLSDVRHTPKEDARAMTGGVAVRQRKSPAIYATLREDTADREQVARDHAKSVGFLSDLALHRLLAPITGLSEMLKLQMQKKDPSARRTSDDLLREASTAIYDRASSIVDPEHVADRVNTLAMALADLYENGVLVSDLHGNNMRWRIYFVGDGWPKAVRPIVSDYGMSAVRTRQEVKAIMSNPAPRAAWSAPRVVRA